MLRGRSACGQTFVGGRTWLHSGLFKVNSLPASMAVPESRPCAVGTHTDGGETLRGEGEPAEGDGVDLQQLEPAKSQDTVV